MLLQWIVAKDELIDALERRTKAIVRTDYYVPVDERHGGATWKVCMFT